MYYFLSCRERINATTIMCQSVQYEYIKVMLPTISWLGAVTSWSLAVSFARQPAETPGRLCKEFAKGFSFQLSVWCTSLFLSRVSLFFLSLSCLVVMEQDSSAAQQYSRQGCPTGLRAELWALILNSTNQPQVTQTHSCTLVAAVSCQCLL